MQNFRRHRFFESLLADKDDRKIYDYSLCQKSKAKRSLKVNFCYNYPWTPKPQGLWGPPEVLGAERTD